MNKRAMQLSPNGSRSADPRPSVAIYRSPLFNASETFVRAHALSLTRYRPILVGQDDKGNVPEHLRGSVCLPDSRSEWALARLGNLRPLARRLAHQEPRLVHAHFGPDALAAVSLAEGLAVPLVATLHGYEVTRSPARLLLSGRLSWMRYAVRREVLIRSCRLFLPVSDALRDLAIARGFPPERTRTHYLGVDLGRFAGGEPEPRLILHVGRLVEKKGTAVLIDAVARLADAKLVVIGEGPLRPSLERQATNVGADVRFLGTLPESEVAHWMRRACLLAAPSVTARDGDAEGLPTVIVEAAASGLPTVGTWHSGIPEAVIDGETGFLVAEHDVAALAARMGTLLESADLRVRMGAAARRLAETRFDLARQTERLEALYDRIAEGRPLD